MDMSFLMPLIIIVIVVFVGLALMRLLLPFFSRKKTREIPRDSLQKLINDLKVSGKFNKEKSVKFLKFEGDRSVYRHRKYKVVGYLPAPECNVFLIKSRIISFSRVFLCPGELSTDINAREISIRARGVRRVNNLIWVPILTEKDIDLKLPDGTIVPGGMIMVIEQKWRNYYDKILLEQNLVEFGEVSSFAWFEAAEGQNYREQFSRSEKMPNQIIQGEKTSEEAAQ